MPVVLGIESSCDETSAAVVVDGRDVRSSIVSAQVDLHARYGGIVPEIAARAHLERIQPVIAEALAEAGVGFAELDAIAVTDGPGLVGSLVVGVMAAKSLALVHGLPLVPVDHLEAHCTSAAITAEASPWPAVALVVSGGHTSLYLVRDPLAIELLGQTIDDAAGEAFDKVAAILELGYPGGPVIQKAAEGGDPRAVDFPRKGPRSGPFDFSYSGLKTAVLYHVYGAGQKYGSVAHLSARQIADVAASFQAALVAPLVRRTLAAAERHGVGSIVVGGGVAANALLRADLASACERAGLTLHLTPMAYCTDNAAMIASRGDDLLRAGVRAGLTLEPRGGLVRRRKTRRGRETHP